MMKRFNKDFDVIDLMELSVLIIKYGKDFRNNKEYLNRKWKERNKRMKSI